jgi:uncharacterized secreted repeat protein (TIGR03808 family)
MHLDRRRLVTIAAAGSLPIAAPLPAAAAGASPGALGLDATQFGLRPGSPDDQSRILQRAIEEAARMRNPLVIPAGIYRAGDLKLPSGARLTGVRGATRLLFTQGASLVSSIGAEHVSLSGLLIDGGGRPLPERSGLLQFENCRSLKILDCDIKASGRNGIVCVASTGEIAHNSVSETADVAIHLLDCNAMVIAGNRIEAAGNNGITVWRSTAGEDGAIVMESHIAHIGNRLGGSGQYGNGVNVFRAVSVMVRNNRIADCAFSAIRGNAASNLHITGNIVSGVREVALYAEFGFEGAIIANNSVDGAAIGISATNFNEGGRLAVVSGNIIRNLLPKRPAGTDPGDSAGIGISVEADSTVSGNIIENAPNAGISLGWGQYLRDVAATGNLVRKADIGIAVSVVPGAGTALIANNVISDTRRGAIVGMARSKPVTGDLSAAGIEQYAHIALSGNRVR